jgi:hypothetical protein
VTYSELVQRLKIAIYQEAQSNSDFVHLDEAAKKYGFEYQEGLIAEAQQDLVATGFISGPKPIGGDTTALGKITGAGRREIEGKFGSKDGVGQILQPVEESDVHNLIASSASTGTPEATHPTLGVFQRVEPTASTTPTFSRSGAGIDFAEPAGPITQVIDSAAWTGTQFVLIDAYKIAEVRRAANELRDAVRLIHFESNSDSVNLHCLVEALVSICEMAEPEGTIVDRILASPKFKTYASLAGIIATIRGAFGI